MQVKGIPFLVFDAGGVLEMFDGKVFKDNVMMNPTLDALKDKLNYVIAQGSIKTVRLAEHITTGRQQWIQWHVDHAESLPQLIEVRLVLAQPKRPHNLLKGLNIKMALLWEGEDAGTAHGKDSEPSFYLWRPDLYICAQ